MPRDLPCGSPIIDYPDQFVLKRGDVSFGFSSAIQADTR
jgi:glutaconate CoA-transferase subunit B